MTPKEELPEFDAKQRAELVETLERAQAEARTGKAIDYEPTRFRDRLVRIYRGEGR